MAYTFRYIYKLFQESILSSRIEQIQITDTFRFTDTFTDTFKFTDTFTYTVKFTDTFTWTLDLMLKSSSGCTFLLIRMTDTFRIDLHVLITAGVRFIFGLI